MSPLFVVTVLSCGRTYRTELGLARVVGDLVRDGTTVTLSLVSNDLVMLLSNGLKAVSSQESRGVFQPQSHTMGRIGRAGLKYFLSTGDLGGNGEVALSFSNPGKGLGFLFLFFLSVSLCSFVTHYWLALELSSGWF